ncbi:MAG: energy transducer TonB [Deltaproteobacteria bacterium]|nr:energy transducer TonB [Deltaproteobacteria bacterium]
MFNLKTPFAVSVGFHILALGAAGIMLSASGAHFTEVTPIEIIEASSADKGVVKESAKAEPVRSEKALNPVAKTDVKEEARPKEIIIPQEVRPVVAQAPSAIESKPAPPSFVPLEKTGQGRKAEENVIAALSPNRAGEEAAYNAAVRQKIERAKFYPQWARKRGYEGIVGVKFNILPDGSVSEVKVVRPCHCEALNKAACEAIENAAPFPRPKSLENNKQLAMDIDIGFRLK